MIKPIFFITVAFGLVLASAPNARAALCFQYTKSGGGIAVAQADLPEPNRCVSLALYEVEPPPSLLGAANGTLCRSTQDNFVIYHYTFQGCMGLNKTDSYFESATCRVQLGRDGSLPSGFSICRGTVISGKPGAAGQVGNFVVTDDLVISKCDADDINFRVPSGLVTECQTEFQLRQTPEQPSQNPRFQR